MDIHKFKKSPSGKVIKTDRDYWAFVPNRLPPKIAFNANLIKLLAEANLLVGKLSEAGNQLPNPNLVIQPYMRREAVESSRIEGTQASLSDLFRYEAFGAENIQDSPKNRDILEVSNYVKAMEYGLEKLKKFPLCLRLLRDAHRILMTGVRGEHLTPGEFRKSQNWIGRAGATLNDATYVPPPVDAMHAALSDLEKYLHDTESYPVLVQCAVIHYQFEAIHPFLDGNGRVGRLLTTLFLCERGYLTHPMLYLSEYFEHNRSDYYDGLLAVSERGEWEHWVAFFLGAIIAQSKNAIDTSQKIIKLFEAYQAKVRSLRMPALTLQLIEQIFINPYITVTEAAHRLNTTFPTANSMIGKLQQAGIVVEITSKQRGRVYCAKELLAVLGKG